MFGYIRECLREVSKHIITFWGLNFVHNRFPFLLRFYNVTSDVLTSIKRTEDSLLRLKRIKKSENPSANTTAAEEGKMTDDDKIRLQFALDTEEFGKQVLVILALHYFQLKLAINKLPMPIFETLTTLK